jgi:hypothetical protein
LSDYHVIASGGNDYNANASDDLLTGLGTPVANRLVPDLIAYQASGTTDDLLSTRPLQAGTFAAGALSHGGGTTGAFDVFNVLTAKGSDLRGALIPDSSLVEHRASSLVNLMQSVPGTTTAVPAFGSPFALSIGSSSIHGPAQSPFASSNPMSTIVTSAPLYGVTSSASSTGLAPQWPVGSTPRLAAVSQNAQEHQTPYPAMPRWELDADADSFLLESPRSALVAESVLDNAAVSLLLSRGQGGSAPASVPGLAPPVVIGALDATGRGAQQDEGVPSATSAVGMVAIGLAAGMWARRSNILNLRKRQPGSRPSRTAGPST